MKECYPIKGAMVMGLYVYTQAPLASTAYPFGTPRNIVNGEGLSWVMQNWGELRNAESLWCEEFVEVYRNVI